LWPTITSSPPQLVLEGNSQADARSPIRGRGTESGDRGHDAPAEPTTVFANRLSHAVDESRWTMSAAKSDCPAITAPRR
jgi:hypothetical protein